MKRELTRRNWATAESVLRGALPDKGNLSAPLLAIAFFGAIYGATMGAYALSSGASGMRALWPMLFGALKVPLLLLLTGALSLPPFFVLYTLSGLREDFSLVLRSLAATQVALSAILASLAPFTLLCYFSMPPSSANYAVAVLWNFALFGVASALSQSLLRFHLRALWQRDARHLNLLRGWIVIYGFIGVQLAWLLRPFVGDPQNALGFLRADAFSNAYIAIWGLMMRALS